MISKTMFDTLIPYAQEYMKRLMLFWEKGAQKNRYRRKKVRDAADILTAKYIICGGSDEGSVFKATSLACSMQAAGYDYKSTIKMLKQTPSF